MNKDKDFFDELDELIEDSYNEMIESIKNSKIKLTSTEFEVDSEGLIKSKYGLNDNITIRVNINSNNYGKLKYYYKGIEVTPDCYYLRPKDYHEVSTLDILHECIRQETFKPDIKFLERGENITD